MTEIPGEELDTGAEAPAACLAAVGWHLILHGGLGDIELTLSDIVTPESLEAWREQIDRGLVPEVPHMALLPRYPAPEVAYVLVPVHLTPGKGYIGKLPEDTQVEVITLLHRPDLPTPLTVTGGWRVHCYTSVYPDVEDLPRPQ